MFPALVCPPLVAGFFMRGRMGGMTQANKAELLAALSDNVVEIQKTAVRILSGISNDEWQRALDRIVELRQVQRELEVKLGALEN